MNKPATKEPSMDEILSSIRQIIADDDAALAPRRPDPVQPLSQIAEPEVPDAVTSGADIQPLALSADQILSDEETEVEETPKVADFSAFLAEGQGDLPEATTPRPDFIDPDDVAFVVSRDETPQPVRPPEPPVAFRPSNPAPATPTRFAPMEPPRPRPTAAQAAPMPDSTLSSDFAEELLEPATNAAVRANFARLNNLGLGNPGLTIEAMMRDMLRPMLKEWLDEHLPTMVERMVEREIARVSRGIE